MIECDVPTRKSVSKCFVHLACLLLCLGGSLQPASAQNVTRLTFNQGTDIRPAWDSRGLTIAYIRSKTPNGSVFDAYRVLSSGQGGEQVLLSGLNADFGVAVGLSWIGSTGFLAVEEAISGFEVLKFDTSKAPFNRTVANGSDEANTLLLSIDGGGGGGLTRISRNGLVALVRFSSRGGGGNVSFRSDFVSNMTGQVSSAFGNVLLSANVGSDDRYLNGAAISPDGSKWVLSAPVSTSASPHDLFLSNTIPGAQSINLTNSASAGVFNINPEFSPDGTKVAFARWSGVQSETYDLYVINTDGTGLTQLTNTPNFSETEPSWSPDGNFLAFGGIHIAGHESEFPALQPGESANSNIYILTLPASNIVTPKTKLTEPPGIQISGHTVTFTFAPFLKAEQRAAKPAPGSSNRELSPPADPTLLALMARARSTKAKFGFQYELVVTKTSSKKHDLINRLSRRNSIALANLASGTYSAKYRVDISKKVGSRVTVVGRTKFSPSATFVVG